MLVMILCMYLIKITDVSRIMLGIFYILNIALLTVSKGNVYNALFYYRKKGFNFRNIVIISSRERARDIIDIIGDHLGAGYRVLGCLDETQRGRVYTLDRNITGPDSRADDRGISQSAQI